MSFQSPKCAVCGTVVDSFHVEEMPLVSSLKFTAECHGERQEVVVTNEELNTFTVTITNAFTSETPVRRRARPKTK